MTDERLMQFMYTCRLCGKTYADSGQKLKPTDAIRQAMEVERGNHLAGKFELHTCREHTYGIADFIGIQAEGTS